jgi:hypothetical protein
MLSRWFASSCPLRLGSPGAPVYLFGLPSPKLRSRLFVSSFPSWALVGCRLASPGSIRAVSSSLPRRCSWCPPGKAMSRPASLSAPGPSEARVYTLYPWYKPRRPLPVRQRPAWPPPMFKQGPYWVEPTQQGSLRCTPRRGTAAFHRMQARQAEQKQVQEAALLFIGVVLVFAFIAVFLSAY